MLDDDSQPREPWKLTASQIATAVRCGRISVREVAESCLKRIEQVESRVGAWVYLDPSLVCSQARLLDRRLQAGERLGPLAGVPVGIKDIFNTADMPTCMGSPIWEGFTPGNDARVVFELRQAGALILGKTVTAEFAVHFPGKTVNPYHPDYSPGTSSSGSAAAVATGMAATTIGSQTAGSTIRPASFCGVYGFKPSFGLIPRTGVLKTLDTLDHVTFFTRSPEDLPLMLEVLRVKGKDYPFVHRYLEQESRRRPSSPVRWRVGFVKTHVWDLAENYVREAILGLVAKLADLPEIDLVETSLPAELAQAHQIHDTVYHKALSYYFKDEYQQNRNLVSPIMQEMIERGQRITIQQYLVALERQNQLSECLDKFLENFDVVISHSTAHHPPRGLHTREQKDPCLIWTLCRVPSLNLPLFVSPMGLPFGAQAIARRYRDKVLLSFVHYLDEQGLLPHGPNPPLEY